MKSAATVCLLLPVASGIVLSTMAEARNEMIHRPDQARASSTGSALATAFERSLTPIVDSSLAGLAEVAFVQGTMNPYDLRDVVVPPSTGHYLHVCLNVTTVRLHGSVTLELVTETGTVLTTESREVSFPRVTPRRPRPVGVMSLVFAVPAEVAWGDAVAAKLSFAT